MINSSTNADIKVGSNSAVLITGSAGDIAEATAAEFKDFGLTVIGVDRKFTSANTELWDRTLTIDLVTAHELSNLVTSALESVGCRLAHVVCVAGGGDAEELALSDPTEQDIETFRRVLDANLTSAFATIKGTVPELRKGRGDRSITLISSLNAMGGFGAPAYSAAKAGLLGLARSLAKPLGQDGIRINSILLGTTNTCNLRRLAEQTGRTLNFDNVAAKTSLNRVLRPEDVGRAVRGIALDMIGSTGSEFTVDNGQSIYR